MSKKQFEVLLSYNKQNKECIFENIGIGFFLKCNIYAGLINHENIC